MLKYKTFILYINIARIFDIMYLLTGLGVIILLLFILRRNTRQFDFIRGNYKDILERIDNADDAEIKKIIEEYDAATFHNYKCKNDYLILHEDHEYLKKQFATAYKDLTRAKVDASAYDNFYSALETTSVYDVIYKIKQMQRLATGDLKEMLINELNITYKTLLEVKYPAIENYIRELEMFLHNSAIHFNKRAVLRKIVESKIVCGRANDVAIFIKKLDELNKIRTNAYYSVSRNDILHNINTKIDIKKLIKEIDKEGYCARDIPLN